MKLRITAIVLAVLMVGSLMAPLGAASTTEENYVSINDDVDLWERSVLPLRIDSGGDTEVEKPKTWLVYEHENEHAHIERNPLGVYTEGNDIDLSFSEKSGVTFNEVNEREDNISLIAGHVEDAEDLSDDVDGLSEFNTSAIEELLSSDEITFEEVATKDLDSSEIEFTYQGADAGLYVFLVVGGDDFDTSSGDLDGEGTIYGIDAAPVQTEASTVQLATDNPVPGDDIEFNVDANLDGDIDHVVAVFDESEIASERFNLVLEGELNEDVGPEDIRIEHSIESVNGVAETDEINAFGQQLGSEHTTGITDFVDVLSFIANEGEFDEDIDTQLIDGTGSAINEGEGSVINASLTGISGENSDTSVTVGTLDNWEPGEYQVIHLAVGEDETELTTAKSLVDLAEDDDPPTPSPSPGGPSGPSPSPPADDDDPPADDHFKGDDDPPADDHLKGDDDPPADDHLKGDDDPPADDDPAVDDDPSVDDDEPDDSIPGFGVVVGLVAILSIALLAARKPKR